MTTEPKQTDGEVFEGVMKELSELIGFQDYKALVKGERLRIDDYKVSFIRHENFMRDQIFVYIDMGPLSNEQAKEGILKVFLKINFELLAGVRGAICMHPETENLFYSFRYALNEKASGKDLLDSLIRFIGEIGADLLSVPVKQEREKVSETKSGHMKMSRLIRQGDDTPKSKPNQKPKPKK